MFTALRHLHGMFPSPPRLADSTSRLGCRGSCPLLSLPDTLFFHALGIQSYFRVEYGKAWKTKKPLEQTPVEPHLF